jgi:hypothetical protein
MSLRDKVIALIMKSEDLTKEEKELALVQLVAASEKGFNNVGYWKTK